MQLPTTLRTVEHYQAIAEKFEELADALACRRMANDNVPERLKHFAREIRENIHFRGIVRH